MSIPNGFENQKDIGLYCYSVERNGDIEVSFKIEEPGNYKLIITEKEINRMKRAGDMMKRATELGL